MPYQHHHPHLPQPYNPQQQQQQQHQRFTSPSFLVYPSSSPFSSPLQGLLSSTEGRGQKGSPSQYQSGGPSAYTGMAAPLPPASAAHQLMYPSYG
ncbi:hypothetical protein Bca52824_082896 [Brassica carinata]|uniref:Uncharacterized protein n=1 Tax=Brassica carinata TaxID=52824 RepID=A0A8X7PKD3_BRACI|nr:hypothetical protein Bca52824_082896 [Brassica carinata]